VSLLRGKGARRARTFYLLGYLLLFLGILGISAAFCKNFGFRVKAVSNLGNPKHNPQGWWIFSAAMFWASIGIIPHVLWVRKRLKSGNTWAILMGLTCVGMIGVALIDERSLLTHGIAAAFAFGGAILGGGLIFPKLFRAAWAGEDWIRKNVFLVLGSIVMALFLFILNEIRIHGVKIPNKALNPAEWSTLLMLFTGVLGLHFILIDPTDTDGL